MNVKELKPKWGCERVKTKVGMWKS